MNGQYLSNRQITVSYAYKKDTKGERHGTPAGKFFLFSSSPTLSILSGLKPSNLTATGYVPIPDKEYHLRGKFKILSPLTSPSHGEKPIPLG